MPVYMLGHVQAYDPRYGRFWADMPWISTLGYIQVNTECVMFGYMLAMLETIIGLDGHLP